MRGIFYIILSLIESTPAHMLEKRKNEKLSESPTYPST